MLTCDMAGPRGQASVGGSSWNWYSQCPTSSVDETFVGLVQDFVTPTGPRLHWRPWSSIPGYCANIPSHHTSWAATRPAPTRTPATTTPKMNPPTWAKNATPLPPLFEG